jgi:hypothetical protein
MASTYNQIFYEAPGKLIKVNDATNEFIISGYRLVVDDNLNRDLLLVNTPQNTGSIGRRGDISFDQHHIYYCSDTNRWVRGRLAQWSSAQDVLPTPNPTPTQIITSPTNWWNFTSDGYDAISNYNFINFRGSFNSTQGYTNNTSYNNCLLNYTSNLVEPSVQNRSFSISFEIKRVNNGFLMGNPFGKLGFHFEFVNAARTSYGPYIDFSLGTHNPPYDWVRARSSNEISNSSFSQIVATNDAINKEIKLYVNGSLQTTTSYASKTLASVYSNPQYKGWGIGASANGSIGGRPVSSVEYYNSINIRYMGFWIDTVLNQNQITTMYNGGSFKRYPFV